MARAHGKQGLSRAQRPRGVQRLPASDDLRYSLILAEELSRLALSYPLMRGHPHQLHRAISGRYLCTEEQKQRWLPGFCTGELITALAMTRGFRRF